MKMYEDLLCHAIQSGAIKLSFSEDPSEYIEGICYLTLQKIRQILDDDHLTDAQCFARIEEIVCEFERIGSNGGSRHDF